MRPLRPDRLRWALVLPTLAALACGPGSLGEPADLVLRGGKIVMATTGGGSSTPSICIPTTLRASGSSV